MSSTLKSLMDSLYALGISQSINNIISNTQSGIDSITEVYDVLYTLNMHNVSKISEFEEKLIGLSSSIDTASFGTSGTSGSNGTSGESVSYIGTSTNTINISDLVIGNNIDITTYANLQYTEAQHLIVSYNNDSHFHGDVINYTKETGSLTLKVTEIQGSGTYSLWKTNLDGTAGGNGTSGTSGSNGTSGTSGNTKTSLNDSTIGGYLLNSNTQRPYKLTVGQVQSTSVTGTINGESIYGHKFYCQPGSVINEIAFRIMTSGASGLGLAACRILIYRTKLNAAGNIVAGDLELDTNINISTLTTGLKVVSGLNHTLSSNTYKDCWFIGIRNYQSGSLSLKLHSNTGTVTWYADLSQSSTSYTRDMGWYFSCPYTASTPASMPATSSTTPSTNAVAEYSNYIMFGYSAT